MFTARQREKAGREQRKGEEARRELVEEQRPPSIPGLQQRAGMEFVSKYFGYFFFPSWQLWQLPICFGAQAWIPRFGEPQIYFAQGGLVKLCSIMLSVYH